MSKLPKVIGITGTIGSGKSTVKKILEESIPVIDCDQINAELLEPHNEGWKAIRAFDEGLFDQDQLNKHRMSASMFGNPAYKAQVEQLLHPLILERMHAWIDRQDGLCAVEVPLLFELNLQDDFDEVWCVDAGAQALERLKTRRHFKDSEIERRIAHQIDNETKKKLSDVFLDNSKDETHLRNQIEKHLDRIRKNSISKTNESISPNLSRK